MAWGSTKHDSWTVFKQLTPLVVLFLVLGGVAFIGYQIYLGITKIQAKATQNIGNKNIVFTKEGMRVGVKHMETEKYVDATQRVLVDVWNQHSTSTSTTKGERKRK